MRKTDPVPAVITGKSRVSQPATPICFLRKCGFVETALDFSLPSAICDKLQGRLILKGVGIKARRSFANAEKMMAV